MDYKHFVVSLEKELEKKKVTRHPYYQMWSCGKLKLESLREYSKQHYKIVDSFPRFMGHVYGGCPDSESRKMILWNLMDEEGKKPHSTMWMDFCNALGMKNKEVLEEEPIPETTAFLDSMRKFSTRNFLEGCAALYAYEAQSPEVASTKMDGLMKFYNIKEGLDFFRVHRKLDVFHSETWKQIIRKHASPDDLDNCFMAAEESLAGFWLFLDGVMKNYV